MSERSGTSTTSRDEERPSAPRRPSTPGEALRSLWTRRSIFYAALFAIFILLSVLFYFAQSPSVAPFIYTVF
jgi:hypothetical protein